MPGRIGFLLVDSAFEVIFADDDVRAALTKNTGGDASFARGLSLLAAAVEQFEASGDTRGEFQFSGQRWKWIRFKCNCCAGGPQSLQAFLLGAPDAQVTYASTVAAMYRLTPRETQTLEALLQGLSVKEVATKMGINPSTAKTFLRSITGKMGVSSRAELMSKVLGLSCSESLQCPFQTALAVIPPPAFMN